MKTFKCSDMGFECDWQTQGENEDQIVNQASQHGREQHGISEITDEMRARLIQKIRDVDPSQAA